MKRLFWILMISLIAHFHLNAQTKIGLKVSPTFVINWVKNVPDSVNVSSDGVGVRPQIGLMVDIPFSENYYFQLGANYISKPVNLNVELSENQREQKKYTLQYLQLPFSLKLFTNEVALDKRIYAQIGTQAEILLYQEESLEELELIEKFSPVSFTLYFGAGMEMYLGTHTILLLGLSYNHGLMDLAKEDIFNNSLILKNDLLSIDVGIKF